MAENGMYLLKLWLGGDKESMTKQAWEEEENKAGEEHMKPQLLWLISFL